MNRASSVVGAQGQSHCVCSSFDVYCLGLVATKVIIVFDCVWLIEHYRTMMIELIIDSSR